MAHLHRGDERWPLELDGLLALGPAPAPDPPVPSAALIEPVARVLCRAKRPVILVPDHARSAACLWPLGPLVRAVPTATVIIASGTHTPMTPGEARAHLPCETRRLVVHDAQASPMVDVGGGRRIAAAVAQADVVVALSQMVLHYLAGFGGGRKMLFPGVADKDTARFVHAASLDPQQRGRPPDVGPGVFEDNPLHRRIVSLCAKLDVDLWGVCSVVDGDQVVDASSGELFSHHRDLAARHRLAMTVPVPARIDHAILSAGSASSSRHLVQAHKALHTASRLVAEGGRLLLLAGLDPSLPASLVEQLIVTKDAATLLADALDRFEIHRQTAWSLKDILERFDVRICSPMPADRVRSWGAIPLSADRWAAAVDALRGQNTAVLDGRTLLFAQGGG